MTSVVDKPARMLLECFPTVDRPPDLVPGRPDRAWMDEFVARHPYRCLPLSMANTSGWEMIVPIGFTATWNGGKYAEDITFKPDHPYPDFHHLVRSHFTEGVVTFHPGYLFRTPPGWSMWVMGPPNLMKDGIQPLSGLVETDWLPFPFTMNWRFTRPGSVRFEKGEAFCFITLAQDKPLAEFDVVRKNLKAEPDFLAQYEAWYREREQFNRRIHFKDPNAIKEAWQRFYFRGELPEETGAKPEGHVNKRRLKPIRTP